MLTCHIQRFSAFLVRSAVLTAVILCCTGTVLAQGLMPVEGAAGALTFTTLSGETSKVAITVDGIDIVSWHYAGKAGLNEPLRVLQADLSKNDWAQKAVRPGTVLLDAGRGRVKFFAGNADPTLKRVAWLPTPHGAPSAILASGNYAYVSNGETWRGLQVVDCTDLANPKLLASVDQGNFGGQAGIDGNRVYALSTYGGITILDISEPQPKVLGRWQMPPPAHHGNRVVPFSVGSKRYFYVIVKPDGNSKDWPKEPKEPKVGLRLVDATNPANMVTTDLGESVPLMTAVRDGVGYLAKGPLLEVYELNAPAAPRKLGEAKLTGGIKSIAVASDQVIALAGNTLQLVDVSDPATPKALGEVSVNFDSKTQNPIGVAADGGRFAHVVVGALQNAPQAPGAVIAYDISNPEAPKETGRIEIRSGSLTSGTLLGAKLYLSDSNYGFWTVDVKDGANPRLAGCYISAGEIQQLLLDRRTGLINLEWGGLVGAVDLEDPLHPRVTSYYMPNRFDDYADVIVGNCYYFGKGGQKVIVDISDVTKPKEIGKFTPIEGGAPSTPMVPWDKHLYAVGRAGKTHMLVVYDVTNPAKPTKVGSVELPAPARAYVAAVTDGQRFYAVAKGLLTVVDVTTPAAMKVMGQLKDEAISKDFVAYGWQGCGRRVALTRGRLFVLEGVEATDDPRMGVYDVSNPAAIKRTHTTAEATPAFQDDWFDHRILRQGDMWTDITARGSYLYICDYWGGVKIFDVSKPDEPKSVIWEFQPYLDLVPKDWSRGLYRKAVASGDVQKAMGLTPEKWARRIDIGKSLSWQPLYYHPGYELFAWNIGHIVGGYLVQPKLCGLAVYQVPLTSEVPSGNIAIRTTSVGSSVDR